MKRPSGSGKIHRVLTDENGHWTCLHGFVTGFFPVLNQPHLIEYRWCGICCEEISEKLSNPQSPGGKM